MEIYDGSEAEEGEESLDDALCAIPGGRAYPFSLCLSLAMKYGYPKILMTTGSTFLLMAVFDIMFYFLYDEVSTLQIGVDIGITLGLTLLNFFSMWFFEARRFQLFSTTSQGLTTYIYPDRIKTTLGEMDLTTGMVRPKDRVIYFSDFLSIKESKKLFTIQSKLENASRPMLLFILKDDRLNNEALAVLKREAESFRHRR